MHLCYFPIPEVIHQLWGISCIPIPEWSRSHWTTGNWNPACLIQQTIKLFILSRQQLLTSLSHAHTTRLCYGTNTAPKLLNWIGIHTSVNGVPSSTVGDATLFTETVGHIITGRCIWIGHSRMNCRVAQCQISVTWLVTSQLTFNEWKEILCIQRTWKYRHLALVKRRNHQLDGFHRMDSWPLDLHRAGWPMQQMVVPLSTASRPMFLVAAFQTVANCNR